VVRAGDPLGTVFARDADGVTLGIEVLTRAIIVADEAEPPLPLISHRVTEAGVELWQE
jgi:pyrimidine-nucleoside phosphorylase